MPIPAQTTSRVPALRNLSLPAPTPFQFRWHRHSCRRRNAQLFVIHLPLVAKRRTVSPIITQKPPVQTPPAQRHFPLALTLPPSVPCYPMPQFQPATQARESRPNAHFPTPRTHCELPSPKSAHLPANTAQTAAKTLPSTPIQPHDPLNALLESAEMRGNEREIDLSILSPRNYKVSRVRPHGLFKVLEKYEGGCAPCDPAP